MGMLVSQAEYARQRGVSRQYVGQMVAKGVIGLSGRKVDTEQADAAATMIANRVDIDYPGIERAPAASLDPDSDLGDLAVTVAVGPLPQGACRAALLSGVNHARSLLARGIIQGAMLALGDQVATAGAVAGEVLETVLETALRRDHGEGA